MAKEKDPQGETEQQREYRRNKLRTWADNRLHSQGRLIPHPLFNSILLASFTFEDGSPGRLFGFDLQSADTIIKISDHYTVSPLGPVTQYASASQGDFRRIELNPRADDPSTSPELSELDPGVRLTILSTEAETLTGESELIGSPITAQEALELLTRLKSAVFES